MSDSLITEEAERVEVDSEEDGFHLLLKSEDGQWYDFRIQNIDLDAFYDQVKARIGPYLRERDEARGTRIVNTGAGIQVFACDPDESGGAYELSDPKHPQFHSVHADLYDQREGK